MLRFLIPAGLFAAPLLFSPQVSHAQTFGSSSSCPCTLHGTVVNSVSGQPVNRALVRLTSLASRATLTDSEGKFQFEGLPSGLVSLEAEKPGFLTEDVPGGPNASFSIRLAPDSPPMILKIAPEGVIFGQVSDERGEPLEGFTITTLVRGPSNTQFFPYMPGRVQADDEGRYRIPDLRPGSYYLVVRPPRGQGVNSTTDSSVPSGFPPHFYPGVSDTGSATPIKLLPGKSVQANFSLKREPFVLLSGTISGYSPSEQVNLMILDATGAPENLEIVFDQASGSFHTKWIPPGSYILTAQSMGAPTSDSSDPPSPNKLAMAAVRLRQASYHSFVRQQVNATSSISDLHLVLQPTTDIPVIVRGLPSDESAGLRVRAFLLALLPKDPLPSSPSHVATLENPEDIPASGDTRMIFAGVPSGTYELMIGPRADASFYAESASCGSIDLLRENLVLGSSGSVPPINVVLRDDPATLSGTVLSGGTPAPALVVLLPQKRKEPITSLAAANGAYSISGLAPGVYRVFAVDNSASFDFQDPSFLQKISSKIQEVTLAPKQSATVNLELARVDE